MATTAVVSKTSFEECGQPHWLTFWFWIILDPRELPNFRTSELDTCFNFSLTKNVGMPFEIASRNKSLPPIFDMSCIVDEIYGGVCDIENNYEACNASRNRAFIFSSEYDTYIHTNAVRLVFWGFSFEGVHMEQNLVVKKYESVSRCTISCSKSTSLHIAHTLDNIEWLLSWQAPSVRPQSATPKRSTFPRSRNSFSQSRSVKYSIKCWDSCTSENISEGDLSNAFEQCSYVGMTLCVSLR